jgi:hypothetical protein
MDEVIWIEVLSRHRSVVSRHRCTGRGIRIGRAYTNDVILDDPYVAPEHAHIVRGEDGRPIVEDLDTANGLYASHGRTRLARLALDDDTIFRIGHTYLRIRKTDHAVAPERQFGQQSQSWPAILVFAAVVIAAEAAALWLADYAEPRVSTYVVPLLGAIVAIAVWSTLWSIISRIFSGQARFEQNLIVALLGALGFEIVSASSAVGAFGLSWSALASYTYVGYFSLLAAMCFVHLRRINPARSMLAAGVMAALLVAAVTIQTLMQSDARPGLGQLYVRNLLPPGLRLAPVKDETSFFTAVETLRDKIDADRALAP